MSVTSECCNIKETSSVESTENSDQDYVDDSSMEDAGGIRNDHGGIRNDACFGRGIITDFKRTVGTHWKQEMTNFNQQTIAVSFFIYFGAIAPAITYGIIYAKTTHNWIGVVEMITATAWCGIIYAFIGGQPMMINGGTGPVLAFAEIIYKMSVSLDVPFLTFNCWIGIWVAIYLCIAAFLDMNRIISYATRFTDEIFALLSISIFFINALGNPFTPSGLYYYFDPNHISHAKHIDDENYSYTSAALLSVIVCIGTVQFAFRLRKTKFSSFFPNQTFRNVITDFAAVGSIAFWTFIGAVVFKSVPLETLSAPNHFSPTYACCTEACNSNWPEDCPNLDEPIGRRPWMVDLGDLNGKKHIPLVAAGPAFLAFILVFLDDAISWHSMYQPAHKLTHGAAHNYDTIVIAFMIAFNSLLGLPWLVASFVRSLNHVHASAEKTPDGRIISVRETRLTQLGIHLLCFSSIFAINFIKVIPIPVLYGVFLYMGLVSLGTNQCWKRIQLLFMQPSKYPIEPFTKYMQAKRIHFFTCIQVVLVVLLYAVKASTIDIAFPIILATYIPIRLYVLPRIFTSEELILIDSDEDTVKQWLAQKLEDEEEHLPIGGDHDSDREEIEIPFANSTDPSSIVICPNDDPYTSSLPLPSWESRFVPSSQSNDSTILSQYIIEFKYRHREAKKNRKRRSSVV